MRNSKNQHGIHSPFVYALVTQCFYDKKNYDFYEDIKRHRKSLRQSKERIEVIDFGAGSRIFSSTNRKVADIAKHVGVSKKRQKLLARLVRYFDSKQVVELGTSIGLASAAMAMGNSKSHITTVEGCPKTALFAKQHFEKYQIPNISTITSTFEAFFEKLTDETFDVFYVDGNHQKEQTLHSFYTLLEHSHNDTVFIIDDIYWNPAMTAAWSAIKNHPQVTVSIDTFQWGFIFLRKEQEKQHFTIRV